jgi:HipA-like protein
MGLLIIQECCTINLTLTLSPYPYSIKILFALFDGLIPEGRLLSIARAHCNSKELITLNVAQALQGYYRGCYFLSFGEDENA